MSTTTSSDPKITLYTSYLCPYAHRVHIALKELGLPYEEVVIDINRPRDEWYLKVNPRGLVPTLKYNDHTLTESHIIAEFLSDLHPSSFLPPPTTLTGALTRARIRFFADTFSTKVSPLLFAMLYKDSTPDEKESTALKIASEIYKEIEPLLQDADPFFGGSEELTLAEVLTASFVLRMWRFAETELVPQSLVAKLETESPAFAKWARKLLERESVTYIWDEDTVLNHTKTHIEKIRAATAAAR